MLYQLFGLAKVNYRSTEVWMDFFNNDAGRPLDHCK
jgi:hypothetical protein